MTALLPAVLLLGGCQPADDEGGTQAADAPPRRVAVEEPVAQTDTTAAEEPAVQQHLPIGEYRVAGADGAEVNLPHGIGVSVTADTIAVASQCVTPRWTYRYVDGRLRTEPIVEPICDRGRYPAEEALAAVFDDPQRITRTPANGIRVEGGGRSVTLFSQ